MKLLCLCILIIAVVYVSVGSCSVADGIQSLHAAVSK